MTRFPMPSSRIPRHWLLAAALVFFLGQGTGLARTQTAEGVVFHDVNGSGSFSSGDLPLPRVAVSNGREVVMTDQDGRFELPVWDDAVVFVIKPSGWRTPLDRNQVPHFFHVHSPSGARGGRFEGLPPTGPLPRRIEFPLYPQEEPESFEVLVFGDTQPRNLEEIFYLAHDSLHELTGGKAAFGVTLGDLVFDNLALFDDLNSAIGTIGIPWRHVIGNHDLDFRADHPPGIRAAYHRIYGPSYYSFSYGRTHFIVLDNIRWMKDDPQRTYLTGLGQNQMAFLRHELERIPDRHLVVLMAHIPWIGSTPWADETERDSFFQLLSNRRNTISIVSHAHMHYHEFLDERHGWPRGERHHMVVVGATCGSWWRGAPDEYGIPHSMMRCGTPTGYAFLSIDGTDWKLRYQAARRPPSFQMHIHAPDSSRSTSREIRVQANIFNALPDAEVRMRVGTEGDWMQMERTPQNDPFYLAAAAREETVRNAPGRPMTPARPSPHIWRGTLPAGLPKGFHVIEVRAKDAWWDYEGRRLIRIE